MSNSDFLFNIRSESILFVPVSGGLDSTYLLWRCVKDTDKPVYTIHISFDNHMGRRTVEDTAYDSIVDYIKEYYRDIQTERITLSIHKTNIPDILLFLPLFANKAIQLSDSDNHISLLHGRVFDDVHCASDYCTLFTDKRIMYNIWDLLCDGTHAGGIITPIEHKHKSDMVKELPDDLLSLTWSCRSPRMFKDKYVPCNKCNACRLAKRAVCH